MKNYGGESGSIMKITIITSTYNAAMTLQTCIDSVSNQTYPDIEHIIIDGTSKDGTPELIKQNAEREGSRISYWLSEPDSGIYDAWNKSLPHISGEWVLFLGADDWLHDREAISRMAPHLENAYPQYIVVYGKVTRQTQKGQTIIGEPWDKVKDEFGYKMIPHQGVFQHRHIFDVGNRFDESYKIAGDFELISRVVLGRGIDSVLFIDTVVTLMNDGGISSAPSLLMQKEFADIARKNGYHVPFWHPYYMSLKIRIFNLISSTFSGEAHKFVSSIMRKLFRSRPMKKNSR